MESAERAGCKYPDSELLECLWQIIAPNKFLSLRPIKDFPDRYHEGSAFDLLSSLGFLPSTAGGLPFYPAGRCGVTSCFGRWVSGRAIDNRAVKQVLCNKMIRHLLKTKRHRIRLSRRPA
jgi:hypothetical protein